MSIIDIIVLTHIFSPPLFLTASLYDVHSFYLLVRRYDSKRIMYSLQAQLEVAWWWQDMCATKRMRCSRVMLKDLLFTAYSFNAYCLLTTVAVTAGRTTVVPSPPLDPPAEHRHHLMAIIAVRGQRCEPTVRYVYKIRFSVDGVASTTAYSWRPLAALACSTKLVCHTDH